MTNSFFVLGEIYHFRGGSLQMRDFAPRARNPALFAKGVYSYGTRPEKKEPGDAAIGQKSYLETDLNVTTID
jgi:hypothetical protein